jgi:potassium/hydrogen antiporter
MRSFNLLISYCRLGFFVQLWSRSAAGVIPAALAGLMLGMKAPGARMIASVTFIAILMTILIQAPTTQWLGHRLGLLKTKART